MRLLKLASRRVRAASCVPPASAWLLTLLVAAGYLLIATPLGLFGGLVERSSRTLAPLAVALLALRVMLLPALVEEVVFRVLLNPHPRERPAHRTVVAAAALSLVAYLLMHLVAGVLVAAPTSLLDPVFLLLAGLLGASCLLLYLRTGSLWPPVFLHWLVVIVWLAAGGRGVLYQG